MNNPNNFHIDDKLMSLDEFSVESAAGKSEKITVNFPILTLAQIDALVEAIYFLIHWQVHWFYSQVQKMLLNQARLSGIKIEFVNPYNSSKICWKCQEKGNRDGKIFKCTSKQCGTYQLDSDLNAARNLILRSKKYKRLLSRL